MELKDYLKILGKNKGVVWGICLIAVGLAMFLDYRKPLEYQGALTATVTNRGEPSNEYSQYYTVSASSVLSQSVENWFNSPNFIADVYQEAQVNLPSTNLKQLQNSFRAKRNSLESAGMVITASASSQTDLEKVLFQAQRQAQEKFSQLKQDNKISSNFSLDISEPLVLVQPKNYLQDIIFSLIIGLILGGMASFIKEYFRG